MSEDSVPKPDNLALSRKEDFKTFAESPRRSRPDLLTRKQLKSLATQARADYDRQRRKWHANIGPVKTPQLAEIHEDLWDIVDSNEQDGDKAKGAVAVDAFPGWARRPRCWPSPATSTSARSRSRARSRARDTSGSPSAGSG